MYMYVHVPELGSWSLWLLSPILWYLYQGCCKTCPHIAPYCLQLYPQPLSVALLLGEDSTTKMYTMIKITTIMCIYLIDSHIFRVDWNLVLFHKIIEILHYSSFLFHTINLFLNLIHESEQISWVVCSIVSHTDLEFILANAAYGQ